MHRSKRRLQPEFAKQRARALAHERSECVRALEDAEKAKGHREARVLITRKNNTRHHNEYHARIIGLSENPGSKFSVFDTVMRETPNFPQALQMIDDKHPTYSQKYKQVSDALSSFAAEVNVPSR